MRHCSSHALHNAASTAANGKVAKLVKLVAAGNDEIKVQKCIQSSMKSVRTLEGSDLQLLTASLATSRFRGKKTWTEIASIVTKKVAEIKVGHLRQIAGSFSIASQTDHEMLAAISSRFKESPESLTCFSWADFIFSLQRAGTQDAELLQVAADAMFTDSDALKRLKTNLIMAFVEACLVDGVFHQGMLCVLSHILVLRMESLNAYDLSKVALTWGTAQLKDDLLLQSLSGAVRQKVSEFPNSRISFTIHGLSLWGCQDKSLLRDLAFAWTSTCPEKPLHAFFIICALAKSEALDGPLCDRIAACTLQFVPSFDARSVARILLACSQAECTHAEFLEALGRTAVEKVSEFTARDLCAVAFAGSKLSLAPILGTCIPEAAVERVSEFDGPQIALMMQAISKLSTNPGKFLPALERAALPHVSSLKAVDLQNIAMAWAKVQAADDCLMKAVAQRTVEMIDTLDYSAAHHIARAYSKLEVRNPGLFAALAETGRLHLGTTGTSLCDEVVVEPVALADEFKVGSNNIVQRYIDRCLEHKHTLRGRDLRWLTFSLDSSGTRDENAWAEIASIVTKRVSEIKADDLVQIAGSFSRASQPDHEMLAAISSRFKESPESLNCFSWVDFIFSLRRAGMQDAELLQVAADAMFTDSDALQGLKPYSIKTLLHVYCSQAECTNVEFLEALGRTAVEKVSQFTVHDLCAVAFAGSKLSLGPILGTSIPEAAVERVLEFDGAKIPLMMDAVSKLSDNPGKFLPTLERAALPHVSSLKAADLRHIAVAWAKAQAADSCLMKAVAQRAVEVIDTLDPFTVTHLAWAFSELRVSNPELFAALGARCNQVVHAFQEIQLAQIAFAFVQENVHDKVLLDSIAKEALTRLWNINTYRTSLLVRAFTQANLESAAVTALLENLAICARRRGWTHLSNSTVVELSDLQKQYVETVQEVLPVVLVNQRHQLGLILTMAVIQDNGTIVNLEVDPEEVVLSNLELTFRSRRDEFLESIGVEVLRLKVKSLDDLKYHLQEIFGNARPSVEQTAFETEAVLEKQGCGEDLELQDLEIPCQHLWKEIEPSTLHSQS